MVDEWAVAITGACAWLVASGASPATVRLRRRYLGQLGLRFPQGPWTLTLDDMLAFLANERWVSPETRKAGRSAIRVLYRYGMATGKIDTDLSARLPVIRVPTAVPRPAPDVAFNAAWARADPRGRLMLALAAFEGLRRGEVARLRTDDIDEHDVLRVVGKGGKVRRVPLHPELAAWLHALPAGYVFPGQIDGHLSPNHVGVVVSRLLGPGWTMHTLRHRFATRAHPVAGLRAVQTLLGHSKPETTMIYTAVLDEALIAAVMAAGPAAA